MSDATLVKAGVLAGWTPTVAWTDSSKTGPEGLTSPTPTSYIINVHYWTMDTYDFVELEAEVYDWQDDMLIPADDDAEAQQHFVAFINSNYDYWLLCLQQF